MKKFSKFCFLSLILFFGFMFNIKAINFCNTGQKYYYDCEDMLLQCNYMKVSKPAYINISKQGNAQVGVGDGDGLSIANWGIDDEKYGFGNAKEKYSDGTTCPDVIIEIDGSYYVTSYELADNKKAKDEGITNDKYNFYLYRSKSTAENIDYSDYNNCASFKKEKECNDGKTASGVKFGCAWNEEYNFCSPSGLAYLACGSDSNKAYDLPPILPKLASYAIVALKTATPVILIIMGMFQLIKAITSQKDDEMKKAQGSLIKKLIAAALIFFVVSIVQYVVKIAADSDDAVQGSIEDCLQCFLNNDCDGSMYYTDGYGHCYSVSSGETVDCPVDNY